MRLRSWVFAVLVASMAASATAGPDAAKSPYEKLDNTKLADALATNGMAVMLGTLADELQATNPSDAAYAMAQMYICQARAMTAEQDAKAKAELLNKAQEKLKTIVDAAKPADPRSLLKTHRYKLLLGDLQSNIMLQPLFERMLFLQGSDQDRKTIVDSTAMPVKNLEALHEAIAETLREWRKPANAATIVVLGNDMEELELIVSYKLGLADLCRGLALSSTDQTAKSKALKEVISVVEPIARQEDNENGMKYWAVLLSARASRELGDYAQATAFLKDACSDKASPPVRVAGMFELCRVLIEKGDFPAALSQLETFRKQAGDLLGAAGKATVDVQYTLLGNYLYEQWAASVRKADPKKADEYALLAQNTLLKFAAEHPELQSSFFELVANRYDASDTKEYTDFKKFSPMIQTAIAVRARGKKTPQGDKLAEELFQSVRKSENPAAVSVRPLAMMNLAELYLAKGDNIPAEDILMEIADKSPDSPLAFPAVINAARVADAVIQDRIEKNQPVAANLRQVMITALEKLFSRPDWANRPQAQGWYFALAWQYDKMADLIAGPERAAYLAKAIAAYGKVPAAQSEAMEARYLAAKSQAELVAVTNDKTDAASAVKALQAFAAEAAATAVRSKPDEARQLRNWGGDAAAIAADILYNYIEPKSLGQAAYAAVAKDWSDTPAVERCSAKLIIIAFSSRKTQTDTQKAQSLLSDYKTKYPDKAAALIAQVIQYFKDAINQQRYDKSKAAELAINRNGYYDCAKFLYDSVKQKAGSAPARNTAEANTTEQMYPYEQMLADATLESGMAAGDPKTQTQRFKEALSMFTACKAHDDKLRENQAKTVDAKLAPKVQAVKAAAGNAPALIALADTFLLKDLPDNGINAREFPSAMTVRNHLELVKKLKDARAPEATAALQLSLTKGYAAMSKTLARSVDAVNLWGLARVYKAMEQYDKAMPIFKTLVDGTPKSDASYWPAELEYCESCLDGYRGDTKMMEGLASRIQQLRKDGDQMGGLAAYFNAIAAKAEQGAK